MEAHMPLYTFSTYSDDGIDGPLNLHCDTCARPGVYAVGTVENEEYAVRVEFHYTSTIADNRSRGQWLAVAYMLDDPSREGARRMGSVHIMSADNGYGVLVKVDVHGLADKVTLELAKE